jgi:hypothetical protein
MRKLVIVMLYCFAPATAAFAQSWQGGLDLLIGSPQGEFRKNVDNVGFGLAGNAGYAPDHRTGGRHLARRFLMSS